MLLPLLVLASLGEWPGWRGPAGMGLSDAKGLPTSWSARPAENVLWTHPLDFGAKSANDHNQSSPIVVGGMVIVLHSHWPEGVTRKEQPRHTVRALSLDKGELRWQTEVAPGPWKLSDLRGGYTAPTPASDGKRLYACFGSSVLAALGLDGKMLWRKEITPTQFDVAMASSPVIVGDTVVMQLDGVGGSSRITAYDGKDGTARWTEKRPKNGFCHSTPVLAKARGKAQLLVAASNQLQGVDPSSGKVLWHASASGDTGSPVLSDGLVYLDSGRGSKGVCVDPTGEGDVTKTHTKWSIARTPSGFASPLASGGLLYRVADPGVLRVWRMKDGEEVATLRLPGVNTAPSPILTADGRIYLVSGGRSYVVRAGEKPEVLGKGELGDPSNASPAVSGGRLIVRGARNVWCIGAKKTD